MTTLDRLTDLHPMTILRVEAPAHAPEWQLWLEEIGFLPGEAVCVMARAPGGDPLVVRIGTSTFALRSREAACVHLTANNVPA